MRWIALNLTLPVALAAACLATNAAASPGGSHTEFATFIQTPAGTQSSRGTIALQSTGPGAVDFTVQTFDGRPPQTAALLIGADGSVAPNPSGTGPVTGNIGATKPARTLAAEMAIANFAGIGAGSSQGTASYKVPVVILTPVGTGTSVQTPLTMIKDVDLYVGITQVQTTTQLPANGSLDPTLVSQTKGTGSVLSDTVKLVVKVSLANGRIGVIRGDQTDTITLLDKKGRPRKQIQIQSLWAFSAAASED